MSSECGTDVVYVCPIIKFRKHIDLLGKIMQFRNAFWGKRVNYLRCGRSIFPILSLGLMGGGGGRRVRNSSDSGL